METSNYTYACIVASYNLNDWLDSKQDGQLGDDISILSELYISADQCD